MNSRKTGKPKEFSENSGKSEKATTPKNSGLGNWKNSGNRKNSVPEWLLEKCREKNNTEQKTKTYLRVFALVFEGFKPVLSGIGSCNWHVEIFNKNLYFWTTLRSE